MVLGKGIWMKYEFCHGWLDILNIGTCKVKVKHDINVKVMNHSYAVIVTYIVIYLPGGNNVWSA